MYGAIIGDIVGSKYEFDNIKTKDFPFFSDGCSFTDDSIMTVAVARGLLRSAGTDELFCDTLVEEMQSLGQRFPYPQGGYGGRFGQWLMTPSPAPYNSFGNGSAMRVSPCALVAVSLEEAVELAAVSASVTHNHPEGIKGAVATAAAVFLARTGHSKEEIRRHIEERYYPLDRTLDEIRPVYQFNEICQGTVPEAIIAFLESDSFEDAIRNAVSIGGDSDTIGAITGSIAYAFYHTAKKDDALEEIADRFLPSDFIDTIKQLRRLSEERLAHDITIIPG